MKIKLPFKLLSRSRWRRIRMALDAWPKMVSELQERLAEMENRAFRAELEASQTRTDARLLSIRAENGERLIQKITRN